MTHSYFCPACEQRECDAFGTPCARCRRSLIKRVQKQTRVKFGRCFYCHQRKPLTVEHIIPKARGGPDTSDNLVDVCAHCNGSKGDKLPSEWSSTTNHKQATAAEIMLKQKYQILPRVRKGRQLIAPSDTALLELRAACLTFRDAISRAQQETFATTYLGKLLHRADARVHIVALTCVDLIDRNHKKPQK
jgi:hypothetical protein